MLSMLPQAMTNTSPAWLLLLQQEYVAEAKGQQAEAAEKLAMVDAKIAQVTALKA